MKESEILATTYHDIMDVIRSEDVEDHVSHLTESQDTTIHTGILCELDKESEAFLGDGVAGLVTSYTVFTRPEIDVFEGDRLKVKHLGRVYDCIAGLPFKFPSHLEIPVTLKERV